MNASSRVVGVILRTSLAALAFWAGLLSVTPAQAQTTRRREATPNIGFMFPRRPAADNSERVATTLERYHATEQRLVAADVVNAPALAAHWRTLTAIRLRLERLERANRLSENADLRRELIRLLEHPLGLSMVGDDAAIELLRAADERRLRDLLGIAHIANRRLGFHVRSVLGLLITSGES